MEKWKYKNKKVMYDRIWATLSPQGLGLTQEILVVAITGFQTEKLLLLSPQEAEQVPITTVLSDHQRWTCPI